MNPASLIAGIPWDFETFPEYLGSIAKRGTMLNFAAYIGHTPLRLYVMGDEAVGREATADEIAKMAALVAEAMDAGAAGFSTSFAQTHLGADGQPIPSRWAGREELDALCRAAGAAGPRRRGRQRRRRPQLPRHLRPGARPRRAGHVHRRAHGAQRRPPQGHGDPPRRPGPRRQRVAPGVVPPAHVLDVDGRAVLAQHQPGLRRADAADPRPAPRRLRRSGVPPPGARAVGERPGRRPAPAPLGLLRDHGVDRPIPS